MQPATLVDPDVAASYVSRARNSPYVSSPKVPTLECKRRLRLALLSFSLPRQCDYANHRHTLMQGKGEAIDAHGSTSDGTIDLRNAVEPSHALTYRFLSHCSLDACHELAESVTRPGDA